jgi:hypothetical protein
MPESDILNNKGWFVSYSKNHVDAITMSVLETCYLVEIGIANPTKPGDIAILESVRLYDGRKAAGKPIAVHRGLEQLQGGNQLLTYIHLSEPFILPSCTQVTLKIKLIAPPSYSTVYGIELYNGNYYNRPEIWLGTDGQLWEFSDPTQVEEGESENGQNSISGPILAFIYRR